MRMAECLRTRRGKAEMQHLPMRDKVFHRILVGLQSRRSWALAIAVAYFAAVSWPLVRAYATFAGTTIFAGYLAWIVAALLLGLPLTVAWTKNRTTAA